MTWPFLFHCILRHSNDIDVAFDGMKPSCGSIHGDIVVEWKILSKFTHQRSQQRNKKTGIRCRHFFFCSHPDKHAKVKSKRQPQSSRRGSFGTSTRKETLLAHLIIRRLLWQNIAVVQPSHFLIHAPFSFVLNFFRSLTVYLRLTDAAREKIATYFF